MTPTFSPKPVRYVGPMAATVLPAPVPVAATAAGNVFAFAFFLLVNFVLFVRPTELIPDPVVYGFDLYQYVILACLALGFPTVLAQLRPDVLEKRPITVCVFGLLLAIPLSHLARFAPLPAGKFFVEYLKVVVYFLLFVGLVTTTARLRMVLNVVFCSVVVVAAAALLQYHNVITLPTISAVKELGEPQTYGEAVDVTRLRGTGIFRDPNDFCVLLAMAIPLGLYRLTDRTAGPLRVLWLAPVALLGYGVLCTYSRGGLLALIAGVGVVLVLRFGKRVGVALAVLLVPALLLAFVGSRQGSFSDATSTGTGHDRIQLWSSGLVMLRESPVFGVGHDEYGTHAGQVAHNSYLHTFAETGLFGGTFFLGACFLTLRRFYRLRRDGAVIQDPEARRLVPFVGGACAAYCAGMMTLTLSTLVPTAMILAVGEVTPRLARTDPESPEERFDLRLLGLLFVLGILFLVGLHVFVRLSL
jgi:O-antigen ligase